MPVQKRTLPKMYQTKAIENSIIALSYKGQSKTAIIRALKLPHNIFQQYDESYEWFLEGRDKLATAVSKNIVEAIPTSYLDRKLLVEKLNIFSESFKPKKITSPKQSRDLIATAIQKFTQGEITEQTLSAIIRACNSFIESYNQTILMEDVGELKQLFKEKE
jgi:hypothetical protein